MRVPTPGQERTSNQPPWRSTISFTTARPTPKPPLSRLRPASARQKEYLRAYASARGIALPDNLEQLSRSEASRIADRWIAAYGKLEK